MSVVVSLLRAIDRADGEALVMHVGEKPYVITATGHAELASNALTVPAMTGMLDQLLPAESRQALNELGAVEYQLPPDEHAAPGTHYSVVAARGGDDIWIEVRRRKAHEVAVPVAVGRGGAVAVEEAPPSRMPEAQPVARVEEYRLPVAEVPEPVVIYQAPDPVAFEEPEPPAIVYPEPHAIAEPEPAAIVEPEPYVILEPEPAASIEPEPYAISEPEPYVIAEPEPAAIAEPVLVAFEEPAAVMPEEPPASLHASQWLPHAMAPVSTPEIVEAPVDRFELRTQSNEDLHAAAAGEVEADEPLHHDAPPSPAFDFTAKPEPVPALPPVPAIVAPKPRVQVFIEPPPPGTDPLHHLLKVAAGQGASALYVAPQAKPSLRVEGEMRVLDDAPITDAQLEAGLRTLVGPGSEGAPLPLGEFETRELSGVGRVQCLLFRDHRGLGATFRMLPGRTVSAEQAGLSASIQALCTEPEGLLIVAGAQGAGKSTLVAALVDQINRTRRDHIITVESDIQFVHENRTSFVSQREATGESQFMEAVRSAVREAPDVLVIDGVMSPEVAMVALQAAANGLVLASVTASTTSAALERFVALFGNDAPTARATVGEHLRGVVTQALLRKTGGGRAAAREVLVNVPSVAALVANAQFDQLSGVLNTGRRVGMVPLNDALLGLVQNGALDVRQAFRKSPDQNELVGMLNKAGFDTSFAERLS